MLKREKVSERRCENIVAFPANKLTLSIERRFHAVRIRTLTP